MPLQTIHLDSGSPFYKTPPHIIAATKLALDQGRTDYIMSAGDPELVEAIATAITKETGSAYEPNQVLITNGASSALYAVMAAVLQPGDEVIVFDPSYFVYPHIVRQLRAKTVPVPLDARYQLDVDAVRSAISPKTKLLLLNNPNNPTGSVFDRSSLERLCALCAEKGILLVSDEAYAMIVRDGYTHVPILSFMQYRDNLVLIGTFSKSHAMTGWRLGYLVGPASLTERVYRVHFSMNGPICSFVQRAGLTAMQSDQSWFQAMHIEYERRADLAYRLASTIPTLHPIPSQGTFYLWCRYDIPLPADRLCDELERNGVRVRSGSAYGAAGEHHFRISYPTDITAIEKGMSIVQRTLDIARRSI